MVFTGDETELSRDNFSKQITLNFFYIYEIADHCMEFVGSAPGDGVMQMDEFQLLSQKEQIAMLYQQGIYIGKEKAGGATILLYQLDSFYIEITYAIYRRAIQTIKYSDSTSILDPYLDQIPIQYLAAYRPLQ